MGRTGMSVSYACLFTSSWRQTDDRRTSGFDSRLSESTFEGVVGKAGDAVGISSSLPSPGSTCDMPARGKFSEFPSLALILSLNGIVHCPSVHWVSSTTTSQNTALCFPLLLLRVGVDVEVDAAIAPWARALAGPDSELLRLVDRFNGDAVVIIACPA